MAAVTARVARVGALLGALFIVTLVSVACGPSGPSGSASGGTIGPTGFRGHTVAGPTCPVVRPNDPACADRPVAGATIHVLDASGSEIARLVSDATGGFGLAVPAGTYRLVADPAQGALRAPAPTDVIVSTGIADVDLAYDTGIR